MGYRPVNKYLPPRPRREAPTAPEARLPEGDGSAFDRLFAWADRILSGKPAPRREADIDYSGKLEG